MRTRRPGQPGSKGAVLGTAAAYAAGVVAFGYALVSLYWALGGRGLISTVGGYVVQFADRGGAGPVLVAWADVLVKVAAGLLAFALVMRWGRRMPRVWLLTVAAAASIVLLGYGGVNVLAEALVVSGVIHSSSSTDWTALRWHLWVWDLWFLVWGILLGVATVSYWRRTRLSR